MENLISWGITDGNSANARKTSLKMVQHEVLSGHLRLEEERSFTLAFSSMKRHGLVKPHVDPLVIMALISSF